MIQLVEAMDMVVNTLAAAGLRATLDLADVNPPCVLVQPPAMRWTFGGCALECDFELVAVASATTQRLALAELGQLVTDVQAALGGRIESARPADVSVAAMGIELAGMALTFTEKFRDNGGPRP